MTNSYNVSVNGAWTNGSAQTWVNTSTTPSGWVNITVFAFNSSGTGTLSPAGASQNTQAPAGSLPAVRYINGTVIDNATHAGLAGATVSINTSLATTTDATGFYSLAVAEGSYNLTASMGPTYYTNSSVTVSTVGVASVTQNIALVKKPTGTISGSVKNS
ncbi:CarboxypepD_reg-like domain protein [uncultured archaeon]|nr:CarboxypepD_reg-like domain protein [uncultured archaeon]